MTAKNKKKLLMVQEIIHLLENAPRMGEYDGTEFIQLSDELTSLIVESLLNTGSGFTYISEEDIE